MVLIISAVESAINLLFLLVTTTVLLLHCTGERERKKERDSEVPSCMCITIYIYRKCMYVCLVAEVVIIGELVRRKNSSTASFTHRTSVISIFVQGPLHWIYTCSGIVQMIQWCKIRALMQVNAIGKLPTWPQCSQCKEAYYLAGMYSWELKVRMSFRL